MAFDFMTALLSPLCRDEMLLPSDLLAHFVMKVYDHENIQALKICFKQMQVIKLCCRVVESYIWQVFLDKPGLQTQWGNSVGSHRLTEDQVFAHLPWLYLLSVGWEVIFKIKQAWCVNPYLWLQGSHILTNYCTVRWSQWKSLCLLWRGMDQLKTIHKQWLDLRPCIS